MTHIFFCSLPDCGNATLRSGTTCIAHTGCPDCGDMGAVSLGSVYCHGCQMRRSHSCERNRYCYLCKTFSDDGQCHKCQPARVVRLSDEHKVDLLANLPDTWSFTPAPRH
jgi:hypothetical protein